jgi:hypothetical protein
VDGAQRYQDGQDEDHRTGHQHLRQYDLIGRAPGDSKGQQHGAPAKGVTGQALEGSSEPGRRGVRRGGAW